MKSKYGTKTDNHENIPIDIEDVGVVKHVGSPTIVNTKGEGDNQPYKPRKKKRRACSTCGYAISLIKLSYYCYLTYFVHIVLLCKTRIISANREHGHNKATCHKKSKKSVWY